MTCLAIRNDPLTQSFAPMNYQKSKLSLNMHLCISDLISAGQSPYLGEFILNDSFHFSKQNFGT